jgi:hypothetical protein
MGGSTGAGRGSAISAGTRGTSVGAAAWAASAARATRLDPRGSARRAAEVPRPARAASATSEKRTAASSATWCDQAGCAAAFSSFTRAPVSIFTGHAAWHIESPAQVVTPS